MLTFILLVTSCGGGGDDDAEAPASTTTPQELDEATGAVTVDLVAESLLFDQAELIVPAEETITIRLDNRDASVLHNFAVYVDNSAAQAVFVGDLATGPTMVSYSFKAPAPGIYFFRCDVHPDTMSGELVAQ
jgi:plastocyanin